MTLFLAREPASMRGVTADQLSILRKMGTAGADGQCRPRELILAADRAHVIIDGLIGYGLKAAPQGLTAGLIEAVAGSAGKVLSLDLPGGIDATTGEPRAPVVRANATMTLALPKTGLYAPSARPYVGDLYLADIGVPPALYAEPSLGLNVPPLFARSDLLRIEHRAPD